MNEEREWEGSEDSVAAGGFLERGGLHFSAVLFHKKGTNGQ